MSLQNVARFTVTLDTIKQALGLPEDTNILNCRVKRYSEEGSFESPDCYAIELMVSHPDLPEVCRGQMTPEINPSYHKVVETITFDWNA